MSWSVIRKIQKGHDGVWPWWDCPLRKLFGDSLVETVVLAPYISSLEPLLVQFCSTCEYCSTDDYSKLLTGFVFGGGLLLGPLLLALAYLHVQDAPDGMMTFFFFSIRRKYLPGCMLLVAFLMAGPQEALKQAFGLVAAHLYDFLTRIWPSYGGGYNPIRTPQVVQRWFARPSGASTTRSYGTAFQSRPAGSVGAQPQTGSSRGGGWTSGFTSGAWGSRGPGRRLGGD